MSERDNYTWLADLYVEYCQHSIDIIDSHNKDFHINTCYYNEDENIDAVFDWITRNLEVVYKTSNGATCKISSFVEENKSFLQAFYQIFGTPTSDLLKNKIPYTTKLGLECVKGLLEHQYHPHAYMYLTNLLIEKEIEETDSEE